MEQLGLRSARQIMEEREELEAEDLDQMSAAHNERRRRRGKAEMTVADIEHQVMEDFGEQRRRREAYLADRELDQSARGHQRPPSGAGSARAHPGGGQARVRRVRAPDPAG